MVKSFFVTGTDTDVGKTLVARTLLLEFAAHGLRCAGYKPISAGCARTPDGLRNLDAVLLQEAASLPLPYDLVNPYAYEPPIAPHIAASEARDAITLKGLSDGLRQIEQAGAELVVVEGRGLVPAARSQTSAVGLGQAGEHAGHHGSGGQTGLSQPCPAHLRRHSQQQPAGGGLGHQSAARLHESLSGKSGHPAGLAAGPVFG